MKRAPWLYSLMQIALWSIHGVLISYAQRYLAGMGMRDSAIGLLLGGATAAGSAARKLTRSTARRRTASCWRMPPRSRPWRTARSRSVT